MIIRCPNDPSHVEFRDANLEIINTTVPVLTAEGTPSHEPLPVMLIARMGEAFGPGVHDLRRVRYIRLRGLTAAPLRGRLAP